MSEHDFAVRAGSSREPGGSLPSRNLFQRYMNVLVCCTRLCRWTGDVVVFFFLFNGAVDQKYLGLRMSFQLCAFNHNPVCP